MPRRGTRRHRRSSKRMLGGSGAAEHAASVFGNADQQAAAPGQGNSIAMKGGSALASSEYSSSPVLQKGGKTIIADIGVPAALIYARQLVSRRRGKSSRHHRSHRRRSSRR